MIAVVTGASSGLGAATARRLASEPGAHLVLVARRRERLDELAAELGGATVVAADLLEEATPALVARRVAEEHGRLDLLVNNAGVGGRGSFAEGGWAEVHRVMAINFDAQVRLTEALLPLLRQSAPSAVVNIGSVAGRVARAGTGAYSASKFALAGWTEALQLEEARHGVHVSLVQPGFVATEGFPQRELLARPWTRWMVSTEDKVAEAVLDVWRNRR
ncbi:MAG TPA: SDR family NAD(P)-dependent oxidoreductase, partial [Actinomycetes bacterium]|nr:SDR family NAD(P)-dependent oxidoreductase [Actinomycetes bacterium]